MPTRIFPFLMLSQYPSIAPCLKSSDPQSGVNRQRTVTLGAVESDEPSLAAAPATSQIDISLEYNTKSCIVFNFSQLAILKTWHYIVRDQCPTEHREPRYYSSRNVCSVMLCLESHRCINAKSEAYIYFGPHITGQKNYIESTK